MRQARLLADRLAAEILATAGFTDERPSDIDEIADRLGVSFCPNDVLRTEGRVVGTAAGPVIEFNSRRPPARQRFTKAHELAHLWIARPELSPLAVATRAAFRVEEEMCDTVGAALLLPRRWVDAHADDLRLPQNQTMETLGWWAQQSGVSREAAVIRFRDVFDWPKILLTWEKRGRWRYTGECGVRPWEYGRIRPEDNIASDHLPQAASQNGRALPAREVCVTVGGALEHVSAELVVEGPIGYALIDNPFLRGGVRVPYPRRGCSPVAVGTS